MYLIVLNQILTCKIVPVGRTFGSKTYPDTKFKTINNGYLGDL